MYDTYDELQLKNLFEGHGTWHYEDRSGLESLYNI